MRKCTKKLMYTEELMDIFLIAFPHPTFSESIDRVLRRV